MLEAETLTLSPVPGLSLQRVTAWRGAGCLAMTSTTPSRVTTGRSLGSERPLSQSIIAATLWFAAVGAGLMAGVYFTFSAFVMTALARLPQAAGIAAMQSINRVILRSPFMPLFFATTIASLALAMVAVVRWGEPGAATMLAGGVTYVVGMFLCTALCNVPLNNALDAVDRGSAEADAVWTRYLTVWTRWNHVRTLACTVACGLFIAAIAASARAAGTAAEAIMTGMKMLG